MRRVGWIIGLHVIESHLLSDVLQVRVEVRMHHRLLNDQMLVRSQRRHMLRLHGVSQAGERPLLWTHTEFGIIPLHKLINLWQNLGIHYIGVWLRELQAFAALIGL